MKIDRIVTGTCAEVATVARESERLGFDGLFVAETNHDPFLPLVLAADATERLELGTAIAVAFARTPMTMAYLAWDLQLQARGRLVLGLGSQIEAHITKRFAMTWSHPVGRMREFITAMRAIWTGWQDGSPLDFRGDFYTHSLMTPMFDPGPQPFGPPRVLLAGVGPRMTQVAGEVADGLLVHNFSTPKYLAESTLPALERGLAVSGRTRAAVEVAGPVFVVTGRDDAEQAESARLVRKQLGFYGSTPAYRAVLEAHGWGDAQPELRALSKLGEWEKMADVFDDTMLATFAVVA